MKKNIIINPVSLKGKEINERIKHLMGSPTLNENIKGSVLELAKIGADGKAYGVVKENHEYYIKTSNKTKGLTVEDFNYIGGLQNKKDMVFPSYSKALKKLNLKLLSLNEAYGVDETVDAFHDSEELYEVNQEVMDNFEQQYGDDAESIYYATANKQDIDPETFETNEMDISLNESNRKFSIGSALNDFDNIVKTINEDLKKKV